MKTYEIYNLTTGEILADNLAFDEVPELFEAYASFYPDHEIIACCRDLTIVKVHARVLKTEEVNRNNFMAEWFDLMDELFALGNVH
jgi:hypothetical protein